MALTLHGTVSDNTVALDRKTVPPIFINGDKHKQTLSPYFSVGLWGHFVNSYVKIDVCKHMLS